MRRRQRPPTRRKLPDTRPSITHRTKIDSATGGGGTWSIYLIVGLTDRDEPGEVFIQVGKQGTPMRGLMDTCAIQMSWLLQLGVPLAEIVEQFKGTRFEPYGRTSNPDIEECSSIVDYVVRWLERRFLLAKETD